MSKKAIPRFSPQTLKFLERASRQKNPEWLERNRAEYEEVLLEPLKHLATHLKATLTRVAPDYNFPTKGIGRLRRPSHRVKEHGGKLYRGWMSYSAARPRTSRFDHNPNLFFLINPEDKKDSVLIAGGLYMPSSRQTKSIRQAISENAAPFEKLFKDKAFTRHFKGGFSSEKSSKRPPRGFDPNHPKIDWLKLQAFFVWKSYPQKQFASPGFAQVVEKDFRQVVRLNELLEKAIAGRWGGLAATTQNRKKPEKLSDLLESMDQAPVRPMDF